MKLGVLIFSEESPSSQSRMSDGVVDQWTSSWVSFYVGSITAIGCIQYLSFCRTLTTHMLRIHAAALLKALIACHMYNIVVIILRSEHTVGRDIFNILSILDRAIIHSVKRRQRSLVLHPYIRNSPVSYIYAFRIQNSIRLLIVQTPFDLVINTVHLSFLL